METDYEKVKHILDELNREIERRGVFNTLLFDPTNDPEPYSFSIHIVANDGTKN